MTYISDLTEYDYSKCHYYRPVTKAVGWLSRAHSFETALPTDDLLDLIWQYCKFAVARMRGYHICEFCPTSLWAARDLASALEGFRDSDRLRLAGRNGEELLLGSAEIRVFGKDGLIYAAPNLIYHYVAVHQYKAPDEFLEVVGSRPGPLDPEYLARLEELSLDLKHLSVGPSGGSRSRS
jgi:hypothetical protein